jgi:hypothetical protein
MLRTIAISLILLISVGVMLPFTNSAHGVRQSAQVAMRRHHRYHSRAWWRRYRTRLRKKRAAAALAHRNAMLGQPQNIPVGDLSNVDLTNITLPTLPKTELQLNLPRAARMTLPRDLSRMTLPSQPYTISSDTAPSPMTLRSAPAVRTVATVPAISPKASDVKATVKSTAPTLPGQMNLTVVALSRPNPVFLTTREESKMLGGTAVSDLRRIVIDKMVVAGGWVTNDFVREINGARVFVVTAHTPKDKNSPEKAWTFYFTEADGRIYGLTTDAPLDSADRMSTEAERFINKLHVTTETKNP